MGSSPQLPEYVVVFGPGANCTLDTCPLEYSVYGYRPSLAANILFVVLFALAGILHIFLGLRWRTWFFMVCMVLGCLNAVMGYVGRVMMYYNPFNFGAFMQQIICVSSTPVYFCAAIYVTLSFFVEHSLPALSRFQPKLFYWIFIPCDLFSLAVQATGGVLSTISSGTSQTGVNLAIAGLAFQVFTTIIFCGLFGDYLVRYFRFNQVSALELRVRLFFAFLALAILLITARCVYRLVELHQGYSGHFIKDEGLFVGLEGV
ncbi:RTA1 like protein-domain-containing protein [Ilyonectria sp. MPI-CAGE-AT-0026]|nr:RTA1 like protein-domain-containing protein [Ilyonectria sp. MPI-CAGE-AT-0026]